MPHHLARRSRAQPSTLMYVAQISPYVRTSNVIRLFQAQVIAQKIWEDQHLFEEEPRPVPCADAEPAVATQVPPQDQRSPSRKGGHHSGQPSWASNTHPLGFDSESNEYAYVTALSPPPRRQNDPVRSRVVRHEDSKPVYSYVTVFFFFWLSVHAAYYLLEAVSRPCFGAPVTVDSNLSCTWRVH